MKLNWFSPLPPARTGIAEYSAMLAPSLGAQAEVTFWTHAREWDSALETYGKCRTQHVDLPWGEVNRADVSVFHMGNHPAFHAPIWEAARVHSGIVVLHDLCLQDLWYGIFIDGPGQPGEYVDLMRRFYGPEAATAAQGILSGNVSVQSLSRPYPLFQPAMDNALGVVVHTVSAFEAVSSHCPAAVVQLPLPYAAASPSTFSRWEARRRKRPDPPFKIVVIGFLGGNRRIESLLQALGELPNKEDFRLHFYGSVLNEKYVREQISRYDLNRLVTLHRYVPALDDAIADADLAINLRYPTMGEASLSQLQIWDHALPSIVTRTGWCAALPEDSVLFVDLDREIEDLKQHLTGFRTDPGAFAKVGENGRAVLLRDHAPERYVHELLKFAGKAALYRPALGFGKTAQRGARDLQSWIGHRALDQAADRLAATIATLL